MSFQGSGPGISGTSNQFAVGYSQSAGYTTGNAAGYAPQAGYANQYSGTSQTLQLTSASSSVWGWQGQQSSPSHLWGSNQGSSDTVYSPGALQVSYAGYAGSAGNINGNAATSGYTYNLAIPYGPNGYSNWYWQGQGGTPNHLWGSNDGANMYVWQYGQMTCGTSGYVNGQIGGYAPYCNANAYNANNSTAAWQDGGCGSSAQLDGAMGFQRAGRNAPNGNYWGFFSAYNQQGGYGQINFNNYFGGYWGANVGPYLYQTPSGFNVQGSGYWNSSTQLQMQGQNTNGYGGWAITIHG
jgi:hypothetical protein